MQIVSHAGPAHIDDTIGVAILVHRIGGEALRVPPQDYRQIEALRQSGAALVDVGGQYDSARLSFDHHHDAALPCAAVLVARHFGLGRFVDSPAVDFMSIKDCHGFAEAVARTGHKPSREAGDAEMALTSATMTADLAARIDEVIAAMRGDETYEELILALWNNAPEATKNEAAERHAAKEAAEAQAIASCEVKRIANLSVAISSTHAVPAGRAFAQLQAEIAVSPDSMDQGNTMVVKNTSAPMSDRIDLSRVASAVGAEQVFLHNSGFILVLNGRDHDPEEIVKAAVATPSASAAPKALAGVTG